MPLGLPDYIKCNNINEPIIKLGENQVKGMGVFADIAARTALPVALRSHGYVAVVVDVNKTFIYSNADLNGWGTTTNWKIQGDEAYIHDQGGVSEATWTVTHNLNRYPSVTVIGDDGVPMEGFELAYTDTNILTLKFYSSGVLSAVTGKAFIN
jgi:hypothetical protein